MRLLLELALTHVLGRGRQTVVAGLGVALGVGFSVAMAALMQGSQDDFIRQLVDTMPHVAITDETRARRRSQPKRSSMRRASRGFARSMTRGASATRPPRAWRSRLGFRAASRPE